MTLEFGQDLRVAARNLLRRPSFTFFAVLTLGAGIALNVTVAALLDAYLLRTLPYPAAERLYDLRFGNQTEPGPRGLERLDWARLNHLFEHQISWDLDMFSLTGGDRAEAVPGAWVTPGFVAGLGIRPQIGRMFEPAEFQGGSPQVALISHALWQRRFGGDAAIVGRRFSAYSSDRPDEAETFTIIGVLPEGFWHVNRFTGVFAPLRVPNVPYMVTLRPGVSPTQAISAVAAFVREAHPTLPPTWQPTLLSTHGQYTSRIRPILVTAAAAAGIVLLTACANVAFLLIVRAAARRKEMSIRAALGAPRARIASMLVAEALVLGAAATIAAIALVAVSLGALAPVLEQQLGRPAPGGTSAIAVSPASLAVALAALGLTMLFGLLPVLTSWRRDHAADTQAATRGATAGRGAASLRRALISLEVAASLTLLAGAGLMIRTSMNLAATEMGFRAERVLTGGIGLRLRAYPDDASRAAFTTRLIARLGEIPGVTSAAAGLGYAFQQPFPMRLQANSAQFRAGVHSISPNYFETLSIPIAAGRPFTSSERAGSETVAVVSQSLATLLAGQPAAAIGRQLTILPREGSNASPTTARVIGVAGNVRQTVRDEDTLDVYLSVLQNPGRFLSLYIGTPGNPDEWTAPLAAALRELDPEISLDSPRSAQSVLDLELAQPRFLAWLMSGLAGFAAALAFLGVYGLVAFAVRQQEREVAIRIAVGAESGHIVRFFVRQSVIVLVAGGLAGLGGSFAIGNALRTQLHGVLPTDPVTLTATAALVIGAALVAILLPTLRATRTDPATLLRQE